MTKTAALKQFESWYKANPKAPLITFHKRYNLALAGKPQPTKDTPGILPVSGDGLVGDYFDLINLLRNPEGQRTDLKNDVKRRGQEGTLASPASRHNLELIADDLDIELIWATENSARPAVKGGRLRKDVASRVQLAKASFRHTSDSYALECSLAEVMCEAIYERKSFEASVAQWRECRKLVQDSVAMVCASHRLSCKTCRDADEFSEGDFIAALKEFAATE